MSKQQSNLEKGKKKNTKKGVHRVYHLRVGVARFYFSPALSSSLCFFCFPVFHTHTFPSHAQENRNEGNTRSERGEFRADQIQGRKPWETMEGKRKQASSPSLRSVFSRLSLAPSLQRICLCSRDVARLWRPTLESSTGRADSCASLRCLTPCHSSLISPFVWIGACGALLPERSMGCFAPADERGERRRASLLLPHVANSPKG